MKSFFQIKSFLFTLIILLSGITFACDTSPSIIINQNINNGDGTFTLDLSICIGSGGSADGLIFTLKMG